ncbi:MAG: DMT family transporter [Bacteroidota bacterium]
MKNQNLKAHLALLTTTLVFGLHYTIAKSIMPKDFQPLQLLFLRLLGGVIIFWTFQRFFITEKVDKKDLLILAICGIMGFTMNQALFYEGLNLTTPVDASIIHVLNPVFVLIFASLLIREKITLVKVGGILLGACGALILILYGRKVNMSTNSFTGNILVFINMFFYAMYLVMIKPMVAKYHTTTILKWVSLFGFLFLLPFAFSNMVQFQFGAVSTFGWLMLGYILIFCTFLAYLLINYALKVVDASTVSFYTYLQPLIASITSVSLGGETITFPKVIAAGLIFAGVFLVNRKSRGREVGNASSQ